MRTQEELNIAETCKIFCKRKDYYGLACYVADELLDHFQYKPIIADKPELLRKYENLSDFDRLEFERKYPQWRKGDVEEWEQKVRSTEMENQSNLMWLETWRAMVEDDPVRRIKFDETLKKYQSITEKVDSEDLTKQVLDGEFDD